MSNSNYWKRMRNRRLSRRAVLRSAATAGVGAAGLALVGCGDDDDDDQPQAVAQQRQQQQDQPQAAAQQQQDQQQQAEAAQQAADQAEQQEQAAAQQDAAQQRQQRQAATAQAQQELEAPPIGGELRISDTSDLASFDGFLTFGYKAFLHGHNCYPMLTQFSNNPGQSSIDFQPELWLAESYEQPDDVTWLFNIKENAVWEDREPVNGRNVTAADVAFSFEEERYGGYPNRGAILPSLVGVDAPDDRTVRFDLNGPLAPFLLYLGHHAGPYVMPPELLVDEMSRQTMISAGPFLLDEYEPGSRVVYKRNPNYFDAPKPYAETLVINFIGDNSAIAAAFLSGELNTTWFGVAPPIVEELENGIPGATWEYQPSLVIGGVFPDLALEPFNDPRVRQAMSVAIDRDAILTVGGALERGQWSTALPPLAGWWVDPKEDDALGEFYRYNPEKAMQLLDAAGVDGLDGVPFHTTTAYGPIFAEQSQVVQANLLQVGISVDLVVNEPTVHYSTIFNGSNTGVIGHTLSVASIEPDEALRNVFIPDSPRSPIPNGELMGEDQQMLDLLNAQRTEGDVETRRKLLYDLQLHIANQMYSVPWVNPPISQVARPELSGVQFIQTFAPSPSLEDMWFNDL